MAARKRSAPKPKGTPHPLRLRKTLSFGADASAAAALTFDTPLHQIGGGIMMLAAYIQPQNPANVPACVIASNEFHAQLVLGEVTDYVNEDDQQCISTLGRAANFSASGAATWDWPVYFPCVGGIPIITKEITLVMEAINNASWNSVAFTLTMVYVPHKVDDRALMQHLMAFTEIS